MSNASVELWGRPIGAVSWLDDRGVGVFQYTPDFASSNIQVAPIMMPLRTAPYEFPSLPIASFKGLPGLLADSLPDKFGNALINIWLAQQGRTEESFNPVERLCYIGTRGLGALEFKPSIKGSPGSGRRLEVDRLVDLANRVLDERIQLAGRLDGDDVTAMEDILRVGTSAGGARAKAVLAWNERTGEFRSGQVEAGKGFTYWLMKFDGVDKNRDRELADPKGYGRIEYAYHLMAKAAGIFMAPCRMHEEGGRAHFMTQRFDRTKSGNKLHYQSFAAMMHYDFETAGANSYEQAILAIKRLGMPTEDVVEQVRRAFFNIVFDVAYSYNPNGAWTSRHQMSLNGKRDHFDRSDLIAFAKSAGLRKPQSNRIINDVADAVSKWRKYAKDAGVFSIHRNKIAKSFRLDGITN